MEMKNDEFSPSFLLSAVTQSIHQILSLSKMKVGEGVCHYGIGCWLAVISKSRGLVTVLAVLRINMRFALGKCL